MCNKRIFELPKVCIIYPQTDPRNQAQEKLEVLAIYSDGGIQFICESAPKIIPQLDPIRDSRWLLDTLIELQKQGAEIRYSSKALARIKQYNGLYWFSEEKTMVWLYDGAVIAAPAKGCALKDFLDFCNQIPSEQRLLAYETKVIIY